MNDVNDDLQKALRGLEVNSLLKDIRFRLSQLYGAQQPECDDLQLISGRWYVWVSHYGTMKISDLLSKHLNSDYEVGKSKVVTFPCLPPPIIEPETKPKSLLSWLLLS